MFLSLFYFYGVIVVAVLIVALEVYAAKRNHIVWQEKMAHSKWVNAYRWRWIIGIPFAVASVFIIYSMTGGTEIPSETETYKVVGFPLIVAVFDEAGRDYVGPFTGPFFIGNAVIWYFFPQVLLYAWTKFHK